MLHPHDNRKVLVSWNISQSLTDCIPFLPTCLSLLARLKEVFSYYTDDQFIKLCFFLVLVKIRNQNQLFYISNDNVDRLIRSQSALENVMDCLVKGVIKFSDFAYLSDNEQRVIDLCEISDELTTYQASYGEIFRIRRSEREAFHKFHRLLAGFWSTCKLAVAGE